MRLLTKLSSRNPQRKDKRNDVFYYNCFEMQTLSREFCFNYANLWMAVLERNTQKIESLTKKFGVNEFYGLFTCIITGRSWDSITKGIDRVHFSQNEVNVFITLARHVIRRFSRNKIELKPRNKNKTNQY